MKTNISTFKSVMIASFFILFSFTLFSFSNKSNTDVVKSYITIVVQYDINGQFITISTDSKSRQIAVLETPNNRAIRYYENEGFEIRNKKSISLYDNTEVLKIINEYTTDNWKLHSQSIAAGAGVGDEASNQYIRTAQYLLEK